MNVASSVTDIQHNMQILVSNSVPITTVKLRGTQALIREGNKRATYRAWHSTPWPCILELHVQHPVKAKQLISSLLITNLT